MAPTLTLHVLPPSHPCKTVEAALRVKGLDAEIVTMTAGAHNGELEAIYGEGNRTVPGMLVDGEPVHGSRAILARLEELEPEPSLYPAPIADAVREAERWGDEELQDLGRRLPWGALHFRPESMGTFAGAGAPPLDPAGTDFAIVATSAAWWTHHEITRRPARRGPRGAAREARPHRRARRRRDRRRRAADRGRPADRRDAARAADARRPAAADRGPSRRAARAPLVRRLPGRRPGRRVPGRLGARRARSGRADVDLRDPAATDFVKIVVRDAAAELRARRASCGPSGRP